MSTVNLNTKDVLVANNNTDPISLLRKGIIKRDYLVGAKEFITIPNAPENFAKRIVSTVPVTIDGIKVKVGDTKTITDIYANVMEKVIIPEVKEVAVVEPVQVEEPEVAIADEDDPKVDETQMSAYIAEHEREEQLSKDVAEAEVGVDASEEVIEEDGAEEEPVESTNNNQNNQFNYKKKRRR